MLDSDVMSIAAESSEIDFQIGGSDGANGNRHMIVWRPTKKAAARLGITLEENPPAATSRLGDWYVNIVPTVAGELYVFVSDATLLTVAVPTHEIDVYRFFVLRVANLLSMIGLSQHLIEDELQHYRDVKFGKSQSRSILGSMNEMAFQLQTMADRDAQPNKPLSLSNAERFLAEVPHSPLSYHSPRKVALKMLSTPGHVV